MHKFIRPETGNLEEVEPEVWQWIAKYSDGAVLKQFDDAGVFHQFREIDQTRLNLFRMVCPGITNKPVYSLGFVPGKMKLIHYYDRYGEVGRNRGNTSITVYVFGYETITDKVLMMIMPDGEVIFTDDAEKVKVTF